MHREIFTNSNVIKICELPQRRIVHWTQVGLVEPVIEASGAGSKRHYSYKNLLEFGLCKELFDLGLGIQSVKGILKDLRSDGDLEAWVENYESYFMQIARRFEEWFKTAHDSYPVPPDLTGLNPFNWFTVEHLKKRIKPDNPVGVLFYCFKREEKIKVIVPHNLREAIESVFSYKDIYQSNKMIIIDLGRIKTLIDHRILLHY